jgi:S-adenosyl-L-methionine hydrolase (adenosine-forming)
VRPLIALLTDFGSRDHYAGTMKGVALGICPDATLVDVTHEVPPQDVLAGALELAACYRYFPSGTIFLVVVDPGVGSARRGIAVEAGDRRFVAPDNGVLTLVLDEVPVQRAVELTDSRYARATVSRTFEGRDRFGPAAAWLATGIDLAALGRPADQLRRLEIARPVMSTEALEGEVLRVDRFGNLITNIDRRTFERFAPDAGVRIRLGDRCVSRVGSTYDDAGSGELTALFGSTDHLELAVNGGSAADMLATGRGARVHVSRGA